MPLNNKATETGFFARQAELSNRNATDIDTINKRNHTTAWIPVTLLNSYANPASTYSNPFYRMYRDELQFKGHIDATTATSGTVAFTLLRPFWPLKDITFLTDIYNGTAFTYSRVLISATTGNVTISWPT